MKATRKKSGKEFEVLVHLNVISFAVQIGFPSIVDYIHIMNGMARCLILSISII